MDLSLPMIEPFRVKGGRAIHKSMRTEREAALERAHFNLFHVQADQVLIDLLTDSGAAAMSAAQWGALLQADKRMRGARASSASIPPSEKSLDSDVVPAHQGRAAERRMTRSEAVAERAQELMLLFEGFLTYGRMTGRDLDTIAIGLEKVLTEDAPNSLNSF
jgi:tryptophanase